MSVSVPSSSHPAKQDSLPCRRLRDMGPPGVRPTSIVARHASLLQRSCHTRAHQVACIREPRRAPISGTGRAVGAPPTQCTTRKVHRLPTRDRIAPALRLLHRHPSGLCTDKRQPDLHRRRAADRRPPSDRQTSPCLHRQGAAGFCTDKREPNLHRQGLAAAAPRSVLRTDRAARSARADAELRGWTQKFKMTYKVVRCCTVLSRTTADIAELAGVSSPYCGACDSRSSPV